MRTLINASNPMPSYIYMPLPDGKADVFIYKFVSEDEEGYTYETNEFRTGKIKERDISVNPLAYLDYDANMEVNQEPKVTTVEISREEFNLLSVEQEVTYHIIEEDGTITIKKGVNM